MSSTIPILYALLLTLMLGSAEGGQRMDPVALLRQTLRYWWKIYKTYEEEVALGYCWADYLLGISDRLSANLSASSLAATSGECSNASTVVRAAKSQQNPFPQNVMADATTILGETRWERHSREKRSSRAATRTAAISLEFIREPGERGVIPGLEMIPQRGNGTGEIINRAGRGSNSIKPKEDKNDEGKRIISDPYVERRQQASAIGPELFRREEDSTDSVREFSSRGTSSRAVNPTPSSGDNDEAGFGSTNGERDARRKVLRSPTTSERDYSFVEGVSGRSFSLVVARGRRRRSLGGGRGFSSRRRRFSPRRRRENPRVNGSLDPEALGDRGTTRDLTRRVLANKNGSHYARLGLLSRLVNANTERAAAVIKPTNTEGNSSCDPGRPADPRTPRREIEELFHDSLREEGRGAEARSLLECRVSGRGKAVGRIAETAGGSNTKKRRYPWSRKEEGSRFGKDASPGTIHSFLSSRLERSRQQMPRENRRSSSVVPSTISEKSKQSSARTLLLPRVRGRFARDEDHEEDATSRSAHNSRSIALKVSRDRDALPIVRQTSLLSSVYLAIATTFKTLGMFVQVGRQIIGVVESNTAFACTMEYLRARLIRWIVY